LIKIGEIKDGLVFDDLTWRSRNGYLP